MGWKCEKCGKDTIVWNGSEVVTNPDVLEQYRGIPALCYSCSTEGILEFPVKEVIVPFRYWLFGGDMYHPRGGILDVLDMSNDKDDLLWIVNKFKARTEDGKLVNRDLYWLLKCWHILDVATMNIVEVSESCHHGASPHDYDDWLCGDIEGYDVTG